jgi:hypothetical protein
MTDDQILTKEWLAQKLEKDKAAAEEAEQMMADERTRENLRAAWKQQTGAEPTHTEVERALAEKRN